MINIIDIEASGLHFDSYPIEIAVLVDGKIHSWLIKPEPSWTYWCERAESIHGISRKELVEKGIDAKQVAKELEHILSQSNSIVYSDAVEWDADWIDTLFFTTGFKKEFHIASLFDLLDEEQMGPFEAVKNEVSEKGSYRLHRAENDVRIIAEAYKLILKQ